MAVARSIRSVSSTRLSSWFRWRCGSLPIGKRLLALNTAVGVQQRAVAVRITPSSRSQAGNNCAQLLQTCHRPQAPLGRRNFQFHLDLSGRKQPSLGWIVCVICIGGKEIRITHSVDAIYCGLDDKLDPFEGLPILNTNPSIDFDDRNLVVFVHFSLPFGIVAVLASSLDPGHAARVAPCTPPH